MEAWVYPPCEAAQPTLSVYSAQSADRVGSVIEPRLICAVAHDATAEPGKATNDIVATLAAGVPAG